MLPPCGRFLLLQKLNWGGNQAPYPEGWRTQVYYAGGRWGAAGGGLEELTFPALSPEQRSYKVFIGSA